MRFKLLAPALAILLISACATVSTAPTNTPANAAAEQLISEGKFREAALAYESDAAMSKGYPHDAALIRAANAWKLAGDENKARNLIAPIPRKKLSGEVAFLHDLLNAEFLLADKRGGEAIAFLNQRRDSVPGNERSRWHTDRYRAFDAAGLKFDVAGEQIWLMDGMKPKERAAAGRNIERLLGLVPAAELAQKSAGLSASEPFYAYVARELKKRGMPLPMPVVAARRASLPSGASARSFTTTGFSVLSVSGEACWAMAPSGPASSSAPSASLEAPLALEAGAGGFGSALVSALSFMGCAVRVSS